MTRTLESLRFELDYWGAAIEDIQKLHEGTGSIATSIGASVVLHVELLPALVATADLDAIEKLRASLVLLREAHRELVGLSAAVGNLVDLANGRQEVIQRDVEQTTKG